MATKVLVFDPGESTGWVCGWVEEDETGKYYLESMLGGTLDPVHRDVGDLIDTIYPNEIVYESFNLYPGKAKSMSWNSFYPCEVIGVICYKAMCYEINCTKQSPGTKKFSGGLDNFWLKWIEKNEYTEHTKDAYFHLKYYIHQLNAKKKKA